MPLLRWTAFFLAWAPDTRYFEVINTSQARGTLFQGALSLKEMIQAQAKQGSVMGWGVLYHTAQSPWHWYSHCTSLSKGGALTPFKKFLYGPYCFPGAQDTGGKSMSCKRNKTRNGVVFSVKGMRIIKSRYGWWDYFSHPHSHILFSFRWEVGTWGVRLKGVLKNPKKKTKN